MSIAFIIKMLINVVICFVERRLIINVLTKAKKI
jgi:hypothetical protein